MVFVVIKDITGHIQVSIEKKDNVKKRIVDYSLFSNEYKSNELYNWINLTLEDWESYIKESISNKRIKSNIVSKELEKYQQCSQNVKPLLNLLQDLQFCFFGVLL